MHVTIRGNIKVPKNEINEKLLDNYRYSYQEFNKDKESILYNFEEQGDYVYLPRNLDKFRSLSNLKFKYALTEGLPLNFKLTFPPLAHQVAPIKEVLHLFKSNIDVLLKAGTRFGKTYSAINIMQNLGVTTLILVDKTLLVQQFISDCNEYSDLNIQPLTNLTKVTSGAYISTFQYLNANPHLLSGKDSITDRFGLVIVDECQILTADTYRNSLYKFNSRYRLGISATPSAKQRGLTNLITDSVGEVKVIGEYKGIEVETFTYDLSKTYQYNPFMNVSEQLTTFFTREEVVDDIKNLLMFIKSENPTARVLIATPYQALHSFYFDVGKELGYNPAILNSESKNKKLKDENLMKFDIGEVDLLLALTQVMKGWSGKLDYIIELFAVGSEENVEQLIGRLRTPYGNKPIPKFIQCYSYLPTFKNKKVTRILNGLGFTIPKGVLNVPSR